MNILLITFYRNNVVTKIYLKGRDKKKEKENGSCIKNLELTDN